MRRKRRESAVRRAGFAFPGPGVTGTGCISEGCRGFLLPQTLNGDTESAEHGEEWTDHQIQCDERCATEKLVLTEQGMELECRIHNRVQDMERMLSEDLTKAEREEFQAVLIKLSRKWRLPE